MKAIWIAFGVLALVVLFLLLKSITLREEISKLEHRLGNAVGNRPKQSTTRTVLVPDKPKSKITWRRWSVPVENRMDEHVKVTFFRSADAERSRYVSWDVSPTVSVADYSFMVYFYKGGRRVGSHFTFLDNLAANEVDKDWEQLPVEPSQVTRVVLHSESVLSGCSISFFSQDTID